MGLKNAMKYQKDKNTGSFIICDFFSSGIKYKKNLFIRKYFRCILSLAKIFITEYG